MIGGNRGDGLSTWAKLSMPFAVAGLVAAALTVLRLQIEVPAATAAFPSRGQFLLRAPFLPSGSEVVLTGPGMIRHLKLPYIALLGGIGLVESATLALATATFCWRAEKGGWIPPLRSVAWILVYAGGIWALSFGTLLATATGIVPPLVAVVVEVPLGIVLFLAPAVVVLESVNPVTGIRSGWRRFPSAPVRVTVGVLTVGYLSYLLTVSTTVLGTEAVGSFVVGTVASITVGGTVHAAMLVWAYRRTRERESLSASHRSTQSDSAT